MSRAEHHPMARTQAGERRIPRSKRRDSIPKLPTSQATRRDATRHGVLGSLSRSGENVWTDSKSTSDIQVTDDDEGLLESLLSESRTGVEWIPDRIESDRIARSEGVASSPVLCRRSGPQWLPTSVGLPRRILTVLNQREVSLKRAMCEKGLTGKDITLGTRCGK